MSSFAEAVPATLLLLLGNLIWAVAGAVYLRRGDGPEPPEGLWLHAKGLQTLAWLLISLQGSLPAFFVVAGGVGLLIGGMACECVALLAMAGWSGRWEKIYYSLLTGVGTVVALFPGRSDAGVLVPAVAAAIGGQYLFLAGRLAGGGPVPGRRRLAGAAVALMGLLLFMPAIAVVRPGLGLNLPQPLSMAGCAGLLYVFMTAGGAYLLLASREKLAEALRRETGTDHLTGLPSRRLFIENAKRQFQFCVRNNMPVSFLMVDIDKFKWINNNYGSSVGDEVLAAFAGFLRNTLRVYDLAVRYSGDNFAILLPGVDEAAALAVAQRIKQTGHDFLIKGLRIRFTVSIGGAFAAPGTTKELDLQDVMNSSDKALAESKRAGGNTVVVRHCLLDDDAEEFS